MVFLKQFFTFINFRKTVRDLGYWIGGTLFFAGVAIALSWQSDWMFWGLLGASTVFIAREMIHYYKLLRNR